LVIFSLLLFSLAFSLDLFISGKLRNTPNFALGEATVWQDVYQGKVQSDMLVYGSSRAWLHIDPVMLSEAFAMPAYNLGIDGHNFSLQYFRHQALLKKNKRPSYILLSVDINTFNDTGEFYNKEQLKPFMLFDGYIAAQSSQYKDHSLLYSMVPALRYAGEKDMIKEAFRKTGGSRVYHRSRGYQGMDWEWTDDLEEAKRSRESVIVSFDPDLIQLFGRFLTECKANNIKVIMLYTPEYIGGQHFVSNRQAMMDTFAGLSKRYAIPFYDYSADSISYQRKYFYNTEHLNRQGSALFTEKLVADLKKDKQIVRGL
jgi:hypothetical protein